MLLKFKIKGEVLLLCYLIVEVIGHKHENCSVLCKNRASLLHSLLQVTLPKRVCVCMNQLLKVSSCIPVISTIKFVFSYLRKVNVYHL